MCFNIYVPFPIGRRLGRKGYVEAAVQAAKMMRDLVNC